MTDRLRLIWAGVVDLWCGWTHGGGTILRDPLDRVNWQCNKCGRWSMPVPSGVLVDDRQVFGEKTPTDPQSPK